MESKKRRRENNAQDGKDEDEDENKHDENDESEDQDQDEENVSERVNKRKRDADNASDASASDSDQEDMSFEDALQEAQDWWIKGGLTRADAVPKPATKALFTSKLKKDVLLLFKFNGGETDPGWGWQVGRVHRMKTVMSKGITFNCQVKWGAGSREYHLHNLQLEKYLVGKDADGKAKLSSFVFLECS